jgi:hypothetical protein
MIRCDVCLEKINSEDYIKRSCLHYFIDLEMVDSNLEYICLTCLYKLMEINDERTQAVQP